MVAGLIFGILDHRGELVKSCSRTMNQEKVTSYGGLMHDIFYCSNKHCNNSMNFSSIMFSNEMA